MWAFFPLFVFTGRNEEGGTGVEGGPTAERGLLPLRASSRHPGGAFRARTHTRVSWRALVSFGGKGEGWRVRKRGTREGMECSEMRTPPAPNPCKPQRGVNLKGCPVSPWEDGVGWGAGRLNLRSCWSTQGAPRYPAIHDNQSERRERGSRSESENMEKLSCGQRALGWSTEPRTKHPVISFSLFVCRTLSTDMSLFSSLQIKGAAQTHKLRRTHIHIIAHTCVAN